MVGKIQMQKILKIENWNPEEHVNEENCYFEIKEMFAKENCRHECSGQK